MHTDNYQNVPLHRKSQKLTVRRVQQLGRLGTVLVAEVRRPSHPQVEMERKRTQPLPGPH